MKMHNRIQQQNKQCCIEVHHREGDNGQFAGTKNVRMTTRNTLNINIFFQFTFIYKLQENSKTKIENRRKIFIVKLQLTKDFYN